MLLCFLPNTSFFHSFISPRLRYSESATSCYQERYHPNWNFPDSSLILSTPGDPADMNANGIRNVSRTQIASTARLSCEGCTKRKVKCDRLIPCTNCRNSGILCIPVERRRLPRGRSRRSVNLSSPVPLEQSNSHENMPTGFIQLLQGRPSSGPSVQTPNILSTQDLPFYTGELDNTPRHNRAFYERSGSSSYSILFPSPRYNSNRGTGPHRRGDIPYSPTQ